MSAKVFSEEQYIARFSGNIWWGNGFVKFNKDFVCLFLLWFAKEQNDKFWKFYKFDTTLLMLWLDAERAWSLELLSTSYTGYQTTESSELLNFSVRPMEQNCFFLTTQSMFVMIQPGAATTLFEELFLKHLTRYELEILKLVGIRLRYYSDKFWITYLN